MAPRALTASLLMALSLGCGGTSTGFQRPTLEQRLPSGRRISVTSCILAWGDEHGERHPDQDSFALEYVTAVPPSVPEDLDREALEVFELIRPISEQWGFTTASVAAFPSAERSGKYDVFVFSRSTDGQWSFRRAPAKVFNTDSGHEPGHP